MFTRRGCPRCTAAREFLRRLEAERAGLRVVLREVDRDPQALARLESATRAAGLPLPGVPSFLVGDRLIVGYRDDATTGALLRAAIAGDETAAPSPAGSPDLACSADDEAPCAWLSPAEGAGTIETGILGSLSVERLGLPLFTVALGLLDGFNPCAMWVLLFLLSMLVHLRDRRTMALVAGTFVLTSGLVYFAFMAAWLGFYWIVGTAPLVRLALGVLALAIGAVNVKDFFAFGRGPSLSIPDAAKPRIYARVRAILRADDLGASLAGVFVLALLVNAVELLCTAGFPAAYTYVLAAQDLSPAQHYAYLALYNVAYVLDDAAMVAIAVATLGGRKLTERSGRWLKLLSGLVMVGLGATLLLRPELLSG